LDIVLDSYSGRRSLVNKLQIQIISLTITTTIIIQHVSPTTTATQENSFGTYPSPYTATNPRGATPRNDGHTVAAD